MSCPIYNLFLRDTVFDKTFGLPLIGFAIAGFAIGLGYDKNMKNCRSFKFATEFDFLHNFFKLERKKAEIGKYLIIQKYEMVYVLK